MCNAKRTVKNIPQNLDVGLVNFSDPTFLLLGDSRSLEWLAEQIRNNSTLRLVGSPQGSGIELTITPTSTESQLSRGDGKLSWEISPSDAEKFFCQLRDLAASSAPAHAYLDIEKNLTNLQLLASIGEYSAGVFQAS